MELNKTTPGINYQINFNLLSSEECTIIKKLAKKYWYVTRIEKKDYNRSSYSIAFLKPVDYITQNFNLIREVVLIMSPYQSFEARTLDVLDDLNVQLLRLEEICCFVASKDTNIKNVLNNFLKSNTESRVVVPFTYEEIISSQDDEFLINRMRTCFYSRDLFGIQDPLKKELYFFGRRDLIQELANKHKNNENAGIFGLRKTGKTSIIYGVIRTLDRKQSYAQLIDCQTLHLQTWNIALRTIIWKIIAGLNLKQKNFKDNYNQYEDQSKVVMAFEQDLSEILRLSKKDILLIFDEIENITFGTSISETWNTGQSFVRFWQVIRSFCQHNETKQHFSFLIAGTNPQCIEKPTVAGADNPIFEQFAPIYIPPFNFEQAEEMLTRLGGYMGFNFEKQAIAAIVDDFGGHPLLIRQMASYIHRHEKNIRPINIGKYEYQEHKKQFYQEEAGFSRYAVMILKVLEDWYKDEYEMLTLLAKEDIGTFKELATTDIFIKHLKSYGIIEKDSTQVGYHFRIEALQNYLSGQFRYHKKLKTDKDKEAEIQERRSGIEKSLRTLVKRQLKSSLGEVVAKEEIIRSIYGPHEIGHKSNIAYSDFFNPQKHKIYLKTLFDTIERRYDIFENLFDVKIDEFKNKAQLLNRYRRVDAHSISISDADFEIFRGIASWFEGILSEE